MFRIYSEVSAKSFDEVRVAKSKITNIFEIIPKEKCSGNSIAHSEDAT